MRLIVAPHHGVYVVIDGELKEMVGLRNKSGKSMYATIKSGRPAVSAFNMEYAIKKAKENKYI
jgi:hypothetical protein